MRRLTIDVAEHDVENIIVSELQESANRLYSGMAKNGRARREDYKIYQALITAANFYRMPDDQIRTRPIIES